MISFEYILLAAAVLLLLLSVLASKVSGRPGVPSLLLFLGVGMLAGSDGPGGVHFGDAYLAQSSLRWGCHDQTRHRSGADPRSQIRHKCLHL
ncbi:MAG TPA: hypothetical protein VK421_13395 [Pyrinomonadaceae bacterium]|nr:hypothetical protein [Pyrinomonadaceae bacterium]